MNKYTYNFNRIFKINKNIVNIREKISFIIIIILFYFILFYVIIGYKKKTIFFLFLFNKYKNIHYLNNWNKLI